MADTLFVTTKPFPNIVSGIRPHVCVFIIKKNVYNRTHGGLNITKTGFQCMDKKKDKFAVEGFSRQLMRGKDREKKL